jgi:hypothetical protein
VTQIKIGKRPRLQKVQNVFKIKEITKTANEAMTEILAAKDLNMTELNHFIYAAATALTEEINGTGSYKSETQRPETPPRVRRIQESINGITKELSAWVEIKRDDRNTQNMKRKRLLRTYKIETTENLDQATEELKQKVSAKTQRLSRYKKRQKQYYQNRMFRTNYKEFYNLLRHTNTNVKKAPSKEDIENFWRDIYGKKVGHKQGAVWIKNQRHQSPRMEWSPVSETEVTMALRTILNWKAPGRDQVQNFWFKQL